MDTSVKQTTLDVKFKKLYDDAVLPYYATDDAVGLDCTAYSKVWDENKGCWVYGLGFAVELPKGYGGFLYPRSSIYNTNLSVCNAVGIIDPDYRGEVSVRFYEIGVANEYKINERCCQLVIMPYPRINIIESNSLSETKRGANGYGSTGK